MDDVRKWLSRLKLDHLAKVFEVNQVDFDTLRLLSDGDLRDMQIPLGPRKKLLTAIKRLIDESGKVLAPISGERRQLTILFCDLVDSTEYAVRMDPEDFSTLTRDYLNQCNIAVRNHNGFAASYIGDAFQALFGYPIAEEDDAERALQLAFELLRLVPEIEVPDAPPLRVRIGIASGVVVVGDYLAAPAGVSTVAMGSIPNLAQKLQTIAEPQTILTDQRTYDSTAGAFEFTDLGPQTLKGFSNLVHVWRAERPHILENRFAKRTQLTELVDRRTELTHLLKLWREVVTENHGQAALICGEPGIGKSRLIFEAHQRMPRCTYLTLQCSTAYSNSALFPFLTLMKRYAGMHAEDPAAASQPPTCWWARFHTGSSRFQNSLFWERLVSTASLVKLCSSTDGKTGANSTGQAHLCHQAAIHIPTGSDVLLLRRYTIRHFRFSATHATITRTRMSSIRMLKSAGGLLRREG